MHIRRGAVADAIPILERAVALCEAYAIEIQKPWAMACLGLAVAIAGRHAEAIERASQGVLIGESLRLTRFQPLRVGFLARAYLCAGRSAEAVDAARSALELARRYREPGAEAWALHLLAECASVFDPDRADESGAAYRRALQVADGLGMRPLVAHCHLGLGRNCVGSGDRDKAREHLGTALAMYREMEMHYWPEQAELALASL
jgi:tetratricopeptide (TPR) repeat protein